jgi:hypothetical protein
MPNSIQDTIGRLAIAKENGTMGQKHVSQVMQFFFDREHNEREGMMHNEVNPVWGIAQAIERLEMALHDLKVVQGRIQDDATRKATT